MKRLMLAIALTSAAALAACEDPNAYDDRSETGETVVEAPVAPAAADAGMPVVAPSATDTPPTDNTTLPPEKRTSEQTVAPESETLFY